MSELFALMNNFILLFNICKETNMMNLAYLRFATIFIRFESLIGRHVVGAWHKIIIVSC